MIIKKILLMMSIVVLIGIGTAMTVSADVENTITSVSIDNDLVKWGDTLTLSIEYKSPIEIEEVQIRFVPTEDNTYPMKSIRYRGILGTSTDATTLRFTQIYDDSTGEGTITMPVYIDDWNFVPGKYQLNSVSISNYGAYIAATEEQVGQLLTVQTHRGDVVFDRQYNDEELISSIQGLKDGESAVVRCGDDNKVFFNGGQLIRKSYLDAIKGKDVTLIFPHPGSVVEILGSDITEETKDIVIQGSFGSSSGRINFGFPENKELPGKMTYIYTYKSIMFLKRFNTREKVENFFSGKKLFYSDTKKAVQGSSPIVVTDYGVMFDVTYNAQFMYVANNAAEITKPIGTSIKKVSGSKKSFTVSWDKRTVDHIGNLTGYQIMYSLDKRFKKQKKTMLIKGSNNTKKKISKLQAKKKYFVKVRTYRLADGKNYYSDWSKTLSVKTK